MAPRGQIHFSVYGFPRRPAGLWIPNGVSTVLMTYMSTSTYAIPALLTGEAKGGIALYPTANNVP